LNGKFFPALGTLNQDFLKPRHGWKKDES
jgi:hypothetical protein